MKNRLTRLLPRMIALAALVSVLILACPSWFLKVAAGDRSQRIEFAAGEADATDPAFMAFIRSVASHIGADESVVLIVPPQVVGSTPWYFYRSKWTLAGRDVYSSAPPQNIRSAGFLIFWNAKPDPDKFEIVIDHPRGALARPR